MGVAITCPGTQSELEALCGVLDDAFDMAEGSTLLRVEYMFDLSRSAQLLALAGVPGDAHGAAVALRGEHHVELTHLGVRRDRQGRGVGRALFNRVCDWAQANDYHEVRWCVSPLNETAVAASLVCGARVTGWLDDAYGFAADACNSAGTDRFRCTWRALSWPLGVVGDPIRCDDHATARTVLRRGGHLVVRLDGHYLPVLPTREARTVTRPAAAAI